MNRVLYLAVVSLFLWSCQGSEKVGGVKISGTITYPVEGGKIILEKLDFSSATVVDSVFISGNTFEMYLEDADQSFYRLNLFDRQYVPFIVGLGDTDIQIEAEGDRPSGGYKVSGSVANDQKNKADSIMQGFNKSAGMLQQEYLVARNSNDAQKIQETTVRMEVLVRNKDRQIKEIIWETTPSVAAVYALNYIDFEKEFPFIDSVSRKFQEELPESQYTISLAEKVGQFSKLAVGSEAPEISLPDPNGNIVTLSSLRGKYVLIDFWAAWCKPCRAENPNVKQVYATYADQGFEILGVSLDRKKEHWVQAIEQDGLPWKHVSDLKYFRSEAAETYEISAIPATYLIDPEGKIVAKGLRGPSLRAKLKEIFG